MTERDNQNTDHHETHHHGAPETHSNAAPHAWQTTEEAETHHHANEETQPKDKETNMSGQNIKRVAGLILVALFTLATPTTSKATSITNGTYFNNSSVMTETWSGEGRTTGSTWNRATGSTWNHTGSTWNRTTGSTWNRTTGSTWNGTTGSTWNMTEAANTTWNSSTEVTPV